LRWADPAATLADTITAATAGGRRHPGKLMSVVATVVIAIIALLHVYFLILEMFLWTKPAGRRAFGLTAEFAEASKTLAANQGLYNGFLAAGLIWGLSLGVAGVGVKTFFLVCVLVAGIFGGLTASRKILWIQALPALIALLLLHLG
jgi:putative membrane protein